MKDELSAEAIRRELRTNFMGREVVYYRSVGSTNEVAKGLAREGAAEGVLVIAEHQTAGKGRLGRRWLAPPRTSLLFSLLFRPRFLAPHQAQRLTMVCSLAVVEAVEEVAGLIAALKWPNDIILEGRKLGGILTELGMKGEGLDYVVVGIGLNVNLDFEARPPGVSEEEWATLAETATSLSRALGREVPRLPLLCRTVEAIEKRYVALREGHDPHAEWASRLITLGRKVKVTTPEGVFQGLAEGVDAEGALLLRLEDGRRRRILAGDVTLRG